MGEYVDPFKASNEHERDLRVANLKALQDQKNAIQNPSSPGHIPSTISRRDYFAAAALQGLLARENLKIPSFTAASAQEYAEALIAKLDEVKR